MSATSGRWRSLAAARPWLMRFVWGTAMLICAGDLWLAARRVSYAQEITRLRSGMSAIERARLDAALASDSNHMRVMIELARRQSRGDSELHLAISVDSGALHLEQGGAILRSVPAQVGPDAWVRSSRRDSLLVAAPRGTRIIEKVLDDSSLVLSGGTRIYADSATSAATVEPGSVRIARTDFRALRPNLRAGQRVYFY